ncbi:chaperone modulator CbpM [Leeuwenhoekiella sp. A16]|uniref:chaperone modulator CbpM n=1 Tax=unclassified Leeuwenhoekiella TaxID=2615029 RepID=UPI003A809C2A
MTTSYNIKVSTFCNSHGIATSLLDSLVEYELVHIEVIESEPYLAQEELPKVEKLIRLHQDMGINPEGIQAIDHLLNRVIDLQKEVHNLKSRLNRYDS